MAMRAPVVVAAVAVALRVALVAVDMRVPVGLSDPALYLAAARALAAGQGYVSLFGRPTAYYPPGYPFFLGGVLAGLQSVGLDAHFLFVVGVLQSLLGGLAAAAVVVAGTRLADRRTGIVAGLLLALWPNLVIHASLLLSETLFVGVFAAVFAALVTLPGDAALSRVRSLLVVAGTAVCTLVRPQSIVLVVPVAAASWLLAGVGRRQVVTRTTALVLGVLLAALPWMVRNAVVMGAFIPMSTNAGENLCVGFHDDSNGAFSQSEDCATEHGYEEGPQAEVARDRELRGRALAWIAAHPTDLPRLTFGKFRRTFSRDIDGAYALESYGQDPHFGEDGRWFIHGLVDVYYRILGFFAVVGIFVAAERLRRSRWSNAGLTLLLAVTATGIVLPLLFFGDYRFKVPIAPCLALLAAMALGDIVDRFRGRSGQGRGLTWRRAPL